MTSTAILSVLLGFSAVCYVLLGVRVTGAIRNTGGLPLGISLVLIGVWVLGGAVELIATSHPVFSAGHMGRRSYSA